MLRAVRVEQRANTDSQGTVKRPGGERGLEARGEEEVERERERERERDGEKER